MSQTQITAGRAGRTSGFAFEKAIYESVGTKQIPDYVDGFCGRKTRSKTDIFITGRRKLSLKNSQNSTQIQVCAFHRFNQFFNDINGNSEQAMKLFFGVFDGNQNKATQQEPFKAFCTSFGYDITKLSQKDEIRRGRMLFTSMKKKHQNALLSYITKNKRQILEFVLSTGFCDVKLHKDAKATIIGYSIVHDDPRTVNYYYIRDVVNEITTKGTIKVRESASVIEIGPVTLQMKGSGKTQVYHDLQFNMAWKDLDNFMTKKPILLK